MANEHKLENDCEYPQPYRYTKHATPTFLLIETYFEFNEIFFIIVLIDRQNLISPSFSWDTVRNGMFRSLYAFVSRVFSILVATCLFLPGHAAGQDAGNLIHWAYAPAFGTGVYSIEGEKTFVITFRPKIDLRKQVDDKIGIKFTLPVSFGLQTLNVDEILGRDLPDNLTLVTLVPGVEFLIPVGRRWMVKPFSNIGWGTSSTDQSAVIYFAGAKSRYAFEWGRADMGFLNELLWAGYQPSPGSRDDFSRFMLGLEADYPIGNVKFRDQQLYIRPHILYYHYFDDLNFLVPPSDQRIISVNDEVELAVAVGTKQPQKFWLFQPDRIGIGLRYGEDLKGVRIFLRSVFD